LIFLSLSPRHREVGFHGRRVEENLVERTAHWRERLKETDPHALGHPAHIAVVGGFPFDFVFKMFHQY
jgi:hypothetical protein